MAAHRVPVCASLVLALPLLAIPASTDSGINCSFRSDPDRFLSQQSRAWREVNERVGRFSKALPKAASATTTIPHRNFIDDEIFGALDKAGVKSARLTTDEEFVRRIYFDLTGRIPTPDQVQQFVSDSDTGKRDHLIDTLLFSQEFNMKWTMWFGDLLGNVQRASNISINARARNNFHTYLRGFVADNRSLATLAKDMVSAKGNSYLDDGTSSYVALQSATNGGPAQDRYDQLFYRSATIFLGMSHYDCLLCHNGRGHLDQVSLWGKNTARVDAEQMAAFFSRIVTRQQGTVAAGVTPAIPVGSYQVDADRTTGSYDLNTNYGNRPNRVAVNGVKTLTPKYLPTGATPSSSDWRGALADNMVKDPMFARNFANRFWKAMFNLGLVDPVDTLDPARLDPNNPPDDPWTFQATHPVLLDKLAAELKRTNFNFREFLRLIVQSNAYQLSSQYDGDWKLDYVPLFARHYPRRLSSEEVVDALVVASGEPVKYLVNEWSDPAQWAMELPDPLEPTGGNAASNLLNSFLRGNRDTNARSQAGSILQQLNMMNDRFVLDRIRYGSSPTLQRAAFQPTPEATVNSLFLTFLSRKPTSDESTKAVAYLKSASNRNNAIEDLAWSLVNKMEFLFSY